MDEYLTDRERLYYSRQMILPGWSEDIQLRLKASKVLVIGAGGLSCPLLQYLTRAGIGEIGIIDGDVVSYSNLHRQSLYSSTDVGASKAELAAKRLRKVNPHITINSYNHYLSLDNVDELFQQYELVADGTDNFPTRYLINDYAVKWGITNVFAAINGFEGQLAVFNYPLSNGRSGQYRDIFPAPPRAGQVPNCAENGVLGTSTAIMGSLQAAEIIKVLLQSSHVFYNQLVHIDLETLERRKIHYEAKKDSIAHSNSAKDYAGFLCSPAHKSDPLVRTYQNLKRLNKNGKSLHWIDVRSEKEHQLDPFNGKCIPWHSKRNVLEYKDYHPLVFYCQTGKRSMEALHEFKKRFPNLEAYSLEGGVESWLYHSENIPG